MANNITVKDGSAADQVLKTTDNAGVHTPHHNIDTVTTITNVVHVDDNGGALTVDGTVAVTNAGITTLAGAVAGSEMQVDVVSLPATPAGTNLIGKTQPFSAILEGGLTELVGINEQVDQNDYSGSIGVALGGSYSGEILSIALYATEDGTGAVQDSAGILYVFDADPTITSGDTSMTAAERVTILGKIAVGAADWDTDANGGCAYISNVVIPFHAVETLYFVWKHLDATGLNDAAGDDEVLRFNFWYRRES